MKQDVFAKVIIGDKVEQYKVIKATVNHFVCRSPLGDVKFSRANGRVDGGQVVIQNLQEIQAHFGQDAAIKYVALSDRGVIAVKVIKDNKNGQTLEIIELVYGEMPFERIMGKDEPYEIGQTVERNLGRYNSSWRLYESKDDALSELMYVSVSRAGRASVQVATETANYVRAAAELDKFNEFAPDVLAKTIKEHARNEGRKTISYPMPNVLTVVNDAIGKALSK